LTKTPEYHQHNWQISPNNLMMEGEKTKTSTNNSEGLKDKVGNSYTLGDP